MKVPLLGLLFCLALRLEAAPANLDIQLLQAANRGDMKTVQALVKRGAKINARNVSGATPLMLAAQHRNIPLVNFLLGHGADVRASDKRGLSCLSYGPSLADTLSKRGAKATQGDAIALSSHLENLIDSEMKDNEVKVQAKMLLSVGMKLNTLGLEDDDQGVTPLISAADSRPSLVPFLLTLGADPNMVDFHGRTPLIASIEPVMASADGNDIAPLALLKHGAKVNTRNVFGDTALLASVRQNRLTLVRELLARGANPNICNHREESPLMFAALGGYADIARLLLEAKSNIQLKNFNGYTALDMAASRNVNFEDVDVVGRPPATPDELIKRWRKGRLEIEFLLKQKAGKQRVSSVR